MGLFCGPRDRSRGSLSCHNTHTFDLSFQNLLRNRRGSGSPLIYFVDEFYRHPCLMSLQKSPYTAKDGRISGGKL